MNPFGFIRHMYNGLHFFQLIQRYMTFDDVAVDHDLLRRRLIVANIPDFSRAARTKRTALGRIHGTGQVALQHNFALGYFRVGNRYGR